MKKAVQNDNIFIFIFIFTKSVKALTQPFMERASSVQIPTHDVYGNCLLSKYVLRMSKTSSSFAVTLNSLQKKKKERNWCIIRSASIKQINTKNCALLVMSVNSSTCSAKSIQQALMTRNSRYLLHINKMTVLWILTA